MNPTFIQNVAEAQCQIPFEDGISYRERGRRLEIYTATNFGIKKMDMLTSHPFFFGWIPRDDLNKRKTPIPSLWRAHPKLVLVYFDNRCQQDEGRECGTDIGGCTLIGIAGVIPIGPR